MQVLHIGKTTPTPEIEHLDVRLTREEGMFLLAMMAHVSFGIDGEFSAPKGTSYDICKALHSALGSGYARPSGVVRLVPYGEQPPTITAANNTVVTPKQAADRIDSDAALIRSLREQRDDLLKRVNQGTCVHVTFDDGNTLSFSPHGAAERIRSLTATEADQNKALANLREKNDSQARTIQEMADAITKVEGILERVGASAR